MFKKLIPLLIILIFLTSAVSAESVPDFNGPDGWDDKGDGAYFGPSLGEGLIVMEYSSENVEDYLTQSDILQITNQNDNTFTYKDLELNQHGVGEVVEVDGAKYIVLFWAGDDAGISDDSLNSVMNEFNELNNVEPIAV